MIDGEVFVFDTVIRETIQKCLPVYRLRPYFIPSDNPFLMASLVADLGQTVPTVQTIMGPGFLKEKRWDRVDVVELSWRLAGNSKAILYTPSKPGFTSPDGKEFAEERAYRKYMFETYYSFRNQTGQKLVKTDGQIGGQGFALEKLDNCEVQLLDVSDSLLIDWVTNSKVFIGPTKESIFLRSCENTTFVIATKQLRTRDCKNCTFYLFCKTEPIVERSENCTFRAFNGKYKGMKRHFRDAKLPRDVNLWWKIYDFSEHDAAVKKPHFTVVRGEPDTTWHIKAGDSVPSGAAGGD